MKKLIAIFILSILLTACGGTPVPTPNPAEVALTMFADNVNAKATQGAVDRVFTATAQVSGMTATSQAISTSEAVTQQARVDAQATANQQLVFAQATQQRIDADARATQQRIDADATQAQARRDVEATANQARLDVQSTQEAQVMATNGAMTQMVLPLHNAWTQQAVEQNILIATNEVEMSNLAVAQQRQKNTPEWVIPLLIALAVTVAGVVYLLRHSRAREFKNDDGEIEVIVFDGKQALNPALMAKPLFLLETNEMPDVVNAAEQSRVTERAQIVKALSVMPVQTSSGAAAAFNKYFSPAREDAFEIIEGETLPPASLLDSETLKVTEKDWQDANHK